LRFSIGPQRGLLAVTAALEALEVGDVALAGEILLAALEDDPVHDPQGRRRRCPVCLAGPYWPGELDRHLRFAEHELSVDYGRFEGGGGDEQLEGAILTDLVHRVGEAA
jgi:hypothetical protein